MIWAGTRAGAARFDGERWEAIDIGEPDAGIAAILAADDGATWLSGSFGVHRQAAGGAGVTYPFGEDIEPPGRVAFSLHQVPGGAIVAGSTAGAAHFDGSVWTTLTVNDGLTAPVVHDVLTDEWGALWFAFRGAGVARREADGWTRYLEGQNVRKLFVARNGDIWAGTGGAGAFVFDGTTWAQHQDGATLLPWDQDALGAIWCSNEGGGVLRFLDGSWTTYGLADGLPSEVVFSVFVDDDGSIWAATDKGLAQIRP